MGKLWERGAKMNFEKLSMDALTLKKLGEEKRALEVLLRAGIFKESETTKITPQRLSPVEASIYINMSTVWLQRGRSYTEDELQLREGRSYIPRPRCIKLSPRRIRYDRNDLDKWMEEYGHGF